MIAFRVLLAVSAFQLAELAHFGGDLAEEAGWAEHPGAHDDNSETESKPDHSCPPGCPDCHHVHPGNAALTTGLVTPLMLVGLGEGAIVAIPSCPDAPRSPPLPSLFRPPRALLRLT